MGLSSDYSALKVWRESLAGANLLGAEVANFTLLNKVNRAVNEVAAEIYPACINSYLTSATPTVVTNAISLTGIRIQASAISRIVLSSSEITNSNISIVSPEQYYAFRTAAQQNYLEIIATIVGSSILLKKGDGLSTYGTVTLIYPRTPTQCTAETDTIDVPDGIAPQLVVLRLQKILADEYKVAPKDTRSDMAEMLLKLFQSLNYTITEQEIKEKSAALS